MLEIRNLRAGYEGVEILHDVNLSAPSGGITVIVGPNGCGKSTLLKSIAGINQPRGGSIRLNGKELCSLPPRELAQHAAYLAQNRQVPEITAERLVLHGRFPYLSYPRRYRREDLQIARRAMETMGISGLARRELHTLSGGQRQKVYIAMALAQDTPVVLMDEPTTFLDIAHQYQMMREARALADGGKTVVLVLHDIALALKYADRIVVMRDGRVLTAGNAEEVFRSGQLQTAFGIRVERTRTADGWAYYYREGVRENGILSDVP